MRIFYFITEFDVGGAERSLWELARRMKKRRHAVAACAASGRGPVGEWLAADGVEVFHLDARSKSDAGVLTSLCSLLRGWKPDVFHSFLFHANIVGRFAAWQARVPVRISSARVAERRRRSHVVLDRLTIGLVDAELAVSEGVARFLREQGRIPAGKIAVVGNAVDIDRFQSARRGALRRELAIGAEAPVIGFIGRLEAQKGPDILLRAFSIVSREIPEARLVLAGEGRQARQMRALARRLNLESSVFFLGWRGDIPEILADLDILVLPSRWEGMANVVLEAFAAGAAVVASDAEGARELLGDSEYGEVVTSLDPRDFAACITRLCTNPQRRRTIAQSAKRYAKAAFSLEGVAGACERIYGDLLAARRPRAADSLTLS